MHRGRGAQGRLATTMQMLYSELSTCWIRIVSPDESRGEAFEFGAPRALFPTGIVIPAIPLEHFFDVAADGQRFLINTIAPEAKGAEDPAPTRITVVVNWTSSLPQ
jgi:hypothetical protein